MLCGVWENYSLAKMENVEECQFSKITGMRNDKISLESFCDEKCKVESFPGKFIFTTRGIALNGFDRTQF